MDAMSSLLMHFRVNTRTFFSGSLCHDTPEYGHDNAGHIHIVHEGQLHLDIRGAEHCVVEGPAVVLFPRPIPHRLRPAASSARLSCGRLEVERFDRHPLVLALPEVVLTTGETPGELSSLLNWLAVEGNCERPGRGAVMDRLVELVLICVFRQFIDGPHTHPCLLQGLAHAGLTRALAAIHEHPEHGWTLSLLAAQACMSRSSFAATFQRRLGCSPIEYLREWRLALVKQGLRRGASLAALSDQVGYENVSALGRAFRRSLGCSPRDWLNRQSCA